MEQHYRYSTFREKLVEHLFIGELLRISWLRGECSLEVSRPEVDSRGYDVIVERQGVVRHIQLKASHHDAVARSQMLHIGLAEKPSGCVVWVQFDSGTMKLGPYLFFGDVAGRPLPSLDDCKVGRHTRGGASGVRGERPAMRVVPKAWFRKLDTAEAVYAALFMQAAESAKAPIA